MSLAIRRILLWLVLGMASLPRGSRGDEPKIATLLQRSPAPANAIMYLHAPSLRKLMSEANMPARLDEKIEEVWAVSELDIFRLTPKWEAGYAKLTESPTADQLAKALNGYVDTIADTSVVWTPRESYLVPIGASGIGFLRPANRSLLSEWLDKEIRRTPPAFLVSQAAQPEQYLSFLCAVDLKDCFSPVTLADRLADFKVLGSSVSTKDVAEILASIQGTSIIVGRRTLNDCILEVEFSKSPETLLPFAKNLLNEILTRNGTEAPEVLKWQTKLDGNKLSFRGSISEESLSGLLELFSLNHHAEFVSDSMSSAHAGESGSPAGPAWKESKEYFDGVVAVIDRVRKYHAKSTGSRARWSEIHARRIDELGTINVDPDLITYGADVSSLLRTNALTMQSVNIQAGQTKAAQSLEMTYSGTNYGSYYGYGGYGYSWSYNPNTTLDYQRVTSAQARGTAYADYRTTMSTIDKITGDTRRAMTQKFGVQF